MKLYLLSTLGFLAIAFSVTAQTTLTSGNVTGTWTKTGSPYIIAGTIVVPAGDSLKIEAGVKVRFTGAAQMFVSGRVLAKGSATDSIEFMTVLPQPQFTSIGIFLTEIPANTDSTVFSYCSFTSQMALSVRNCPRFKIDNCRFSDFDATRGWWKNLLEFSDSKGTIQNTTLERIKNGEATITVWGGELVFRNSIFRYNSATEASGIRFSPSNTQSKPLIEQCTFVQNTSKVLDIRSTYSPVFRNNTFYKNTVDAYYGMIRVVDQSITDTVFFHNNTFSGNSIVSTLNNYEGGAVLNARQFNYINFNGDIFENNQSKKYQGGVIYAEKGVNSEHISTINMADCRFHNNSASSSYGGAIYATRNTSLFINRCVFSNNLAETGGAIALYDLQDLNTNFSIKNSLFANNHALDSFSNRGQGGAIWVGDVRGKSQIYNTTFANNYAPQTDSEKESGAAIYLRSKQLPEITNCIFKGNDAGVGKGKNIAITEGSGFTLDTLKVNYSCLEGGQNSIFTRANFGNYIVSYNNNIDTDPQFIAPSAATGLNGNGRDANFRLKRTSPAINRGIPNPSLLELGDFDLDLKNRLSDRLVDMGAYESQPITTPEIVGQTQSATSVCAGTRVVFRVTAQGANPLTYKWLRNTTVLSSTLDSVVVMAASLTDTGKYICQVTNSFGTVSSNALSLNVDTVPKLNLTLIPDSLCQSANAVTLVASPTGGVWSGKGIVNGVFTPTTAGIGTHRAVYTYTTTKGCIGNDSMPIIVKNCRVGTQDPRYTEGVSAKLFPNPSAPNTDVYLTIQSFKQANLNVDLLSIDGRLLQTLINNTPTVGEQTFMLHPSVESGVFILKIKVGDMVLMQKIVR